MKTKTGISLVVLVITIIIMTILVGITVSGIDNALREATEGEFVVELSTIKDKIKEHYIFTGALPIKPGVEYTADQVGIKHTNEDIRRAFLKEVETNNDKANKFLVIDLDLLGLETNQRGKSSHDLDVFLVATNTLNVYYLGGVLIQDMMRFSLVTLVDSYEIVDDENVKDDETQLNSELSVRKDTNTWTSELKIIIDNHLNSGETLQYSIGGGPQKSVPANNIITINANNMTSDEVNLLAINKTVTINKIQNGSLVDTTSISVQNLDVISPIIGRLETIDVSNESFNKISINSADDGGSGIKKIYYNYVSQIINETEALYYSNGNKITADELVKFGKTTSDGSIQLGKNIKSIIAAAEDNAGNISETKMYTIDNQYLISK